MITLFLQPRLDPLPNVIEDRHGTDPDGKHARVVEHVEHRIVVIESQIQHPGFREFHNKEMHQIQAEGDA